MPRGRRVARRTNALAMPDFCAGAEADAGEPAAAAALRRAQGSVDAAYALHDTLYAASAEQAAETMATARTSAEAASVPNGFSSYGGASALTSAMCSTPSTRER